MPNTLTIKLTGVRITKYTKAITIGAIIIPNISPNFIHILFNGDNNFVGTELDPELSYAKVADACGLKGVTVKTMEETTKAIKQSCEDQKKGITTFIEVILNQELGEPFRRDAMKKPVKVAGIKKEDMNKQPSLVS